MQSIETQVLIIGGGLTGLSLARLLNAGGIPSIIIEARNRLGGRILTSRSSGRAPIELGATWLGKKHTALVDLLQELDLQTFEQALGERAVYEAISTSPPQLVTLPPNDHPSYRIKGGTDLLINALAQKLAPFSVLTGEVASAIRGMSGHLVTESSNYRITSRFVVSTLPPHLLLKTIAVEPSLPDSITKIMASTHTWMADSIKIGLTFSYPFWRDESASGTIVSNVGPIPEMYDHSDPTDRYFALKGFFNGSYFPLAKEERLQLVLEQLRKYYGEQIGRYDEYLEKVWCKDPFTYHPYPTHVLPHQNNGHHGYQEPFLDGRLFIAGSETAPLFPGYMDGAVRSAQLVARLIAKKL